MFVAEVYTILSFRQSSDEGAGNADLLEHERELHDGVRAGHQPQLHQHPLVVQQPQVGVEVVVGGDRVEDQVQTAARPLHALQVGGHHEVVRPDLLGGGLLAGRGGDGGHGVTHSLGQPHPHLAQAADPNDADPHASIESLKLNN